MHLLKQSIGALVNEPINIHRYSKVVLKLASKSWNELKRKYVAIVYNLVCETIATSVINLWKMDTKLNPADPLTKSLARIPLARHLTRLQKTIHILV